MQNQRLHQNLRVYGIAIMLLLVSAAAAAGFTTEPWNHRYNPALMGAGTRGTFESGGSLLAGAQNTYMTLGRIFTETIELDLQKIHERTGGGGYHIGANLRSEGHTTLHIAGIGGGIYSDLDVMTRVSVPKGLFGFLADGFEIDTQYSDESRAVLQSFLEYGAYGSYRWEPYTFAVKIGKYVPLAYSRNGIASYEFIAESSGRIEAVADVQAELYSMFDLENPGNIDPIKLLTGNNGIKIDLGAVYNPTREKPLWGVSFTNLPIYAPKAAYGWKYSMSSGASTEGLLNSLDITGEGSEEEEAEMFTIQDPESDFQSLEDTDQRIFMPLRAGGFYRFTELPMVDLTGHAALVFAEPFRINAGVEVAGSVFPLSILSVALAHEDLAWRSSLGLRGNMRFVDLGMQLSLSGTDFPGMFTTSGAAISLYGAVGF